MISAQPSLSRLAFQATTHCLTGCAIGEVLGMVIATAFSWGNFAAIVLSVILAFFFGYALTMRPLLASGIGLGRASRLAISADTVRSRSWRSPTTRSCSSSPPRWMHS
jgi:hypothetical protein